MTQYEDFALGRKAGEGSGSVRAVDVQHTPQSVSRFKLYGSTLLVWLIILGLIVWLMQHWTPALGPEGPDVEQTWQR